MKPPTEKQLNDLIDEAEVLAHLLIEKANAIILNCRQARQKTAGVSTPANKLHLERVAMDAVARSQKRRKRTNTTQ